MPRKPRVKAGTSKSAALARRKAFAQAYITNGRNGTQAAITAGFSPNGADVTAAQLLGEPRVREMLAELAAPAAERAGVSIERTLQELARLAYADPRRMFKADGTPIPIHEMDEDVAATIASVEVETLGEGEGQIGRTTKMKVWDKPRALEMTMRHLGLYEKDNSQRGPDLALQIVVMGPE